MVKASFTDQALELDKALGDLREAAHQETEARSRLEGAVAHTAMRRRVFEEKKEEFYAANPELRPASQAPVQAPPVKPGTFTPVEVDDEDAVPGPTPTGGPHRLDFQER